MQPSTTNGATVNGMLLSAGGGPSSSRGRSNNFATPMSSQYDLASRRNMLRSNSSLASTNTVTVTTMKKNQSGDQISAAGKGSERLIGHRSSYV